MSITGLLRQKVPELFKPYLREFQRYMHGGLLEQFRIKQKQEQLLRSNYSPETEKLIVFLTPGYDSVSGGILSISSIYEESKKLSHVHGAEVIMCSVPGDPVLLKYTKFKNRNYIYRFGQIFPYFRNLKSLIIHIPEYAVDQFLKNVSSAEYYGFRKIKNVHFNIMLQNINVLSSSKGIEMLKKYGKVTCTTAHERYSTSEIRKKLGIPLHKLSTFVSPEQYYRRDFAEKENLMIISADRHPKKKEIMELLRKQLPRLNINVIENLPYEDYKKLLSRAKWALTFGEGLDGYFVETVFSGGVSFAVWNKEFFSEDFKVLRTVYRDFGSLARNICMDINELDNSENYREYQTVEYDLCAKYYNYEKYVKNLKLFYLGDYTYA